eukprot:COSAG06_NODE_671_length_13206_cov_477.269474_14_plen_94_part_00
MCSTDLGWVRLLSGWVVVVVMDVHRVFGHQSLCARARVCMWARARARETETQREIKRERERERERGREREIELNKKTGVSDSFATAAEALPVQ